MIERPICKQCECFRFRKASGVCGWEAVCTANSRHGRMIDWQYGLSSVWCRKELKDKLEIRICPGWCPKWSRLKHAAQKAGQRQSEESNPLYASDGDNVGQRENYGQKIEESKGEIDHE